MSRCVNLNQAFANAFAYTSGLSKKLREIFSYAGSTRKAMSVVNIVGLWKTFLSNASGMMFALYFAIHWFAPAGLFSKDHSLLNNKCK